MRTFISFGGYDDAPALTDDTGTVTYGELKERIAAAASELARRGVGPGDVLGLQAPNSIAFAVAFHAVIAAGAAVTPIHALLTRRERAHQLEAAGASLVDLARLPGAAEPAGAWDAASVAAGADSGIPECDAGSASAEAVLDDQTLACLPFSSGTTGVPKGARLSRRNLAVNTAQIAEALEEQGMSAGWTVAAPLPFSHIYGLTVLLDAPLTLGAHIVTGRKMSPAQILSCDWAFIAPPLVDPLLATEPGASRVILSGAAPFAEADAEALARHTGARVIQGYGMTEAAPVALVMRPGDRFSLGSPVRDTECRVVSGELQVRGPQVMSGYLDGTGIDEEGWLHTGDLVTQNSDGTFSYVDRIKDLVKYKGHQVSPIELERILGTHPAVDKVAVTRGRDEQGQEIPVAHVVLQENYPAGDDTARILLDYVAGEVAPYKKIRAVRFHRTLPYSSTGKLLRRNLRDNEPPHRPIFSGQRA